MSNKKTRYKVFYCNTCGARRTQPVNPKDKNINNILLGCSNCKRLTLHSPKKGENYGKEKTPHG